MLLYEYGKKIAIHIIVEEFRFVNPSIYDALFGKGGR